MTEPRSPDLRADLKADLQADEEAARFEFEAAERAFDAAAAAVPVGLIDADADEVRRRALAVSATRSAAVVEYRTLGVRPHLDETAEQQVLETVRELDAAAAATAAIRGQSNAVIGLANLIGMGAIGSAVLRVIVSGADPATGAVAASMFLGGSTPLVGAGVALARVWRSARHSRELKPVLERALHIGGCGSILEMADRRDAVDRWEQRRRLAAEAGDRFAIALREWYDVAGVGADPDAVDDLLARADWYRVTRAAVERAGLAHRIASERLLRAEAQAEGGDFEGDEESESAGDRLQIALLRLRRGARFGWKHAS